MTELALLRFVQSSKSLNESGNNRYEVEEKGMFFAAGVAANHFASVVYHSLLAEEADILGLLTSLKWWEAVAQSFAAQSAGVVVAATEVKTESLLTFLILPCREHALDVPPLFGHAHWGRRHRWTKRNHTLQVRQV